MTLSRKWQTRSGDNDGPMQPESFIIIIIIIIIIIWGENKRTTNIQKIV